MALQFFVEQNNLWKFERGHHGKHSCEVIGKDQLFKRKCPEKKSLRTDDRLRIDEEQSQ